MQAVLPTLTDEDLQRIVPPDAPAGFGALETPRGLLPLRALDVQTRIDGLLAEVAVAQTFVNTLSEPLEATYIFPLPDRASVTRFRMEVAGRVVEGVLKEREAARQEYEQALRTGHRAAITEEDRSGVFTLRVGNLLPGEHATIRLTLTELLPYDEGEVTFRFPLVVAPRYIPGTPLPGPSVGDGTVPDTDAVPDASRITPPVLLPGFPNPVQLTLSVDFATTSSRPGEVRSSLHAIVLTSDQGRQRIVLNPGERLNRDFILRFRLGEPSVQTSLVLHPDKASAGEGTFVLTLVPPAGQACRPRDIVFVLDRSGSMDGWKMVAARRAVARMIDTLTEHDHFTVYAFDDQIETPPSFQGQGLMPASDRLRFRAVEFLANVEGRGGTEMAQPLLQAVQHLAAGSSPGSRERERILVLITDGQVGNEDQILRELAPHVQGLRIFTLGVDQAVNAAFLRRLATLGGGLCELVESEDRLDAVLDKIHRRIGTPVLTELKLEPTGLEVDQRSLVPRRLPDLFAGAPLLLMGRYHGAGTGAVVLRGRDLAGRAWSENVRATPSDNTAVAALWARGQVRELEDRYAISPGEQGKLEQQIVETSLKYGVLCRFTAFVAVDVREVVNPAGQLQRITQPVEPAAGWAMLRTEAAPQVAAAGMPAGLAMRCSAPASYLPTARVQSFPAEESEGAECFMACDVTDFDCSPEAAPPVSPAPPPPARPRGKLRKLAADFLGGRGHREEPVPVPEPLDLSAYRRRAQDLLELLQVPTGTDSAERLTRLGMLTVQLAALVEDLTSIGVPATEMQPLPALLKDLQTLLRSTTPSEADVVALWTQAGTALQEFCKGQAPLKSGKRRKSFWK